LGKEKPGFSQEKVPPGEERKKDATAEGLGKRAFLEKKEPPFKGFTSPNPRPLPRGKKAGCGKKLDNLKKAQESTAGEQGPSQRNTTTHGTVFAKQILGGFGGRHGVFFWGLLKRRERRARQGRRRGPFLPQKKETQVLALGGKKGEEAKIQFPQWKKGGEKRVSPSSKNCSALIARKGGDRAGPKVGKNAFDRGFE